MPETPQVAWVGSFVLRVLDGVLAARPDDRVARRMKAMVLALAGRRPRRHPAGRDRAAGGPRRREGPRRVPHLRGQLGRRPGGPGPRRKAVELNPWSAVFHERLAYVSVQTGDWDTAFRESREALRLDPFLRFARMFRSRPS